MLPEKNGDGFNPEVFCRAENLVISQQVAMPHIVYIQQKKVMYLVYVLAREMCKPIYELCGSDSSMHDSSMNGTACRRQTTI
jgi:hypothetical protein